jgi:hypothetical protein
VAELVTFRAFTVFRPWGWAILHAGKDLENRRTAFLRQAVGRRVLVHAGKTYDAEGARWIRDVCGRQPPGPAEDPIGLVGSVEIGDLLEASEKGFV